MAKKNAVKRKIKQELQKAQAFEHRVEQEIQHMAKPMRKRLEHHLTEGKAAPFLFLWFIIFTGNSILQLFGGEHWIGQFWVGIVFLFLAILFGPKYSAKTCAYLGIKA